MNGVLMFLADASTSITGGAAKACGTSCNTNGIGVAFHTLANTLIFLVGAASVIMVIIGGMRYTISRGDAKAVTDAKNTILYAVVGVVVAIVAYAVVSFVAKNIR